MIEVEIDKNIYLPAYSALADYESDDIDIELVWGGRDSGKSYAIAQTLLEQAMALDYFRCILVKQTHESIKDSQWQMLKDIATEWGVDQLFTFRTSPLSITCVNGATFLTRGMDTPGKLRSITNPSHAWVEEANQITEEGFINLITGLRSNKGRVKMYLSFNPEANTADFTDFWIYRTFFRKQGQEGAFKSEIELSVPGSDEKVKLTYRSTHVTYHDNPYVSAQRIAFHESLKETNYYWYRVFTLGLWGNQENDSPWAPAFSRQKHVAPAELFADPSDFLYLSFDFNRNPATCSVIQWPGQSAVRVIECIKLPNSGTDAICDYVLKHYPGYIYIVTGDYSGVTPSSIFKEQVSNYTVIKSRLYLADRQLQITPNPRLDKNQLLVNMILAEYDVQICPVKGKPLIYDLENVRKRPDGTIEKGDRDDPAKQADALDTFRYWCNKFMGWFVRKAVP